MSEDFLLDTPMARALYHGHAAAMPIYDYHCHLPPEEIAGDREFENLTQIWLEGDHYKWRAMRTAGVEERLITGEASDEEKFSAWAATVPATLRNPLYHWTHLELRRHFGVEELLGPDTAESVYARCGEQLRGGGMSTRGILEKMKVKVVCTTDDPVDDLRWHRQMAGEEMATRAYPAFRPDAGMAVEDAGAFNAWVGRLEEASGMGVTDFESYLVALRQRHDFFHEAGCRLSDHGVTTMVCDDYTGGEIEAIFGKVRSGQALDAGEVRQFQSCLLYEFALMDHEKGWVQQYHIGALRSVNSRLVGAIGKDSGFDSIADGELGAPLGRFFDRLDATEQLCKTVVYNLNPRDNALVATMMGNFQDGSVRGKMQFGSGWWFLDQKLGMIDQMNTLSNMGLLSCFVGMLTDSRSFLSYPRHEYFRRILCALIGEDVVRGELPDDEEMLGKLVRDVCYENAVGYFDMAAD
ncbi:MAG: glucuronate isomerase [Verrucomicrobiota bacterium]